MTIYDPNSLRYPDWAGILPTVSSPVGKIHECMHNIQSEFPAITKDQSAAGLRYKFRGIDDGLKALNPLMAKHGVYLCPHDLRVDITEAANTANGGRQFRAILTGSYRWYASDGSYVEAAVVGEGIDMSDKAVMKAQANALKYLIWYTFSVPTSEKKDSEAFND